jgi:hypothetical protein
LKCQGCLQNVAIDFRCDKIEGWDIPARCKGKVVVSKFKTNLQTVYLKEGLQQREDMPSVPKITLQYMARKALMESVGRICYLGILGLSEAKM